MSKVRWRVTVALVAALVAAFVVTGLQIALAGNDVDGARVLIDHGHYSVTRTRLCPIGGGACGFDTIKARCSDIDIAIGGVGWVISPTGKVVNLSAIDLVDSPVGDNAWRVTSQEGALAEGYRVKVRVYCQLDPSG